MGASPPDRPVRILHLSDFHCRSTSTWDSEPVLRALAESIGAEIGSGRQGPDLVAITGDLAHGGRPEEYRLAREWLKTRLWPALTPEGEAPLPRDRLLLVPGNHDVDRLAVGRMVKATQAQLLDEASQDAIAELLESDAERAMLLNRHQAYLDFYGDWLGAPQPLPWWQRTLTLRHQRLHVAGLDSAWMSHGDKERGGLLLGRYQLNATVKAPEAQGADWRLALFHHPWEYLADFDLLEARRDLHLHRDLVLRGHLHEPDCARVQSPDPDRGCLEIAAGCVYEHGTYPNAFQWIELHARPRRARVLHRLFYRGKWQPDRNQPGAGPDGAVEIPLDTPRDHDARRSRPSAPEVPAAYLLWLRRTYSGVDLLGQDAQQGQAIQLSQVYVPALTRERLAETPRARGKGRPGDETADPQHDAKPLLGRIDQTSLYCPAPPGAGKSTFCRWAVLQAIPGARLAHPLPPPEGFEEPAPDDLRRRLPLLVPLRGFYETMPCPAGRRTWGRADLEQALADWIDRAPPEGLSGDLLKAHLARGSAFLLLDGLDEVPVSEAREGADCFPRELLLSGLADALPGWGEAGNRTLLTSRPYGLDAAGLARLGLPTAPLEPLPGPLQDLFIRRWFHTLDKGELAAGLAASIRDREDLAPLAENPMLLTALCVIYGNGRRLPEDRYHLYQRIVGNVLYNRYPGDARSREPVKARLEAVALGMHLGADGERGAPAAEVAQVEIEGHLARFAALNPAYASGRIQPALQREELLTRSGLLLPRAGERAAFYHLSLQEFLAAERLARTSDDRAALERHFRARGPVAEWRPTLLFLFAAQVFNYRDAQWGLDLLSGLAAGLDRAAVRSNPAPAVLVAEALELCVAKAYAIPEALAEGFRRTCLDAIADEIQPQSRQALGLCLGRLGDPRIADLRDPAAYTEVPAGDYVYGKRDEPLRIDTPFLLSRYPVTNGQYRAFLEDGGYDAPAHWSAEGWAWRQAEGVTEPCYWQSGRWNTPNQPVVGVSFWEADACCRWAGGRLPTEREWEAAARGPEGCPYPWCGEWEHGICNNRYAGLGATSPVGLFPRARQARLALDDLAGNCWEWCDSFFYDDRRDPDEARVLRGGAFDGGPEDLRSSFRDWNWFGDWLRYYPRNRYRNIGFRCVLAPPRQP